MTALPDKRCRCGQSGPAGVWYGRLTVGGVAWAIVVWDHDTVPSFIRHELLTFDAGAPTT